MAVAASSADPISRNPLLSGASSVSQAAICIFLLGEQSRNPLLSGASSVSMPEIRIPIPSLSVAIPY